MKSALLFLLGGIVDVIEDLHAGRRDLGTNHPAILVLAATSDQANHLHPIQQSRDVGHTRQHPIPELVAAESRWMGPAEYP